MKLRPLLVSLASASIAAFALIAPASAHAATAAPAAPAHHIRFEVTFTSKGTTLNTLSGDKTYGWNHLAGKTRWGSRSAHVDFLGSVNYVDGSGPFGGFITVTRSNGTKLAFSVDGLAMSGPTAGTSDTRFSGTLAVIGGSGPYTDATGIGSMSGYRKAALGSPVTLTFDLRVAA